MPICLGVVIQFWQNFVSTPLLVQTADRRSATGRNAGQPQPIHEQEQEMGEFPAVLIKCKLAIRQSLGGRQVGLRVHRSWTAAKTGTSIPGRGSVRQAALSAKL
jgi:hypothetical protein